MKVAVASGGTEAARETSARDVCAMSRSLAEGAATPRDFLEACLARIADAQPGLGLFVHVAADTARAEADAAGRELAAGRRRGPLHGLPFAVKDTCDVAGMPRRAGSRLCADAPVTRDAALVSRLRAAGAICVGKLATWEFGTGDGAEYFDLPHPPARNPWNAMCFTGGSSTGAGAAVAAGLVPFALGSDTTGSVRLPAAATGTLGMIATPGLLPIDGFLPNCHSLDVPGFFTWDAAGAAIVMDVLSGGAVPAPSDPPPGSLAGWRIAVEEDTGPGLPDPDPEMAAGFEAALRRIERLGARLERVRLPVPAAECFALTRMIGPVESAAIHEAELRLAPERMGQALRNKLIGGTAVRAVDYVNALRRRTEIVEASDALLSRFDALVTFGALHLPPRLGVEPEMTAFTCETMLTPFNLAACPALVQPTGMAACGLPTHWQIVASRGAEARALTLARVHEAAMPERPRPPAPPSASPAQPAPRPPLGRPGPDGAGIDRLRAEACAVGLGALSEADLRSWEAARKDAAVRGAALPRPAAKEVPPAFGLQRDLGLRRGCGGP